MSLKQHLHLAKWALLEFLTTPITQALITPIILGIIGYQEFGLWVFATSILALGAIVSMGLSSSTTKYISEAGTEADRAKVAQTSIGAIALIGMTLLPVIIAITIILANIWPQIFSRLGPTNTVATIIVVSAMSTFIQELDYVLSAVFRGCGDYKYSAQLEIMLRPVIAIALIIVAAISPTASSLTLSYLILILGKVLIKVVALKSKIKKFVVFGGHIKLEKFRGLMNFGFWSWIQTIGGLSMSVADKLLVGFFFGASDLARYGICTQLAQFAHAIPAAGLQVLFPWISRSVAQHNTPNPKQLKRLSILTALITIPLTIMLYLAAPFVLEYWIGAEFSLINAEMARILIIIYGLLALTAGTYFLLMGMGDVRAVGMIAFSAGIVTLILSMLLMNFGLIDFAMAKFAYPAIVSLLFPRLFNLRRRRVGNE